MQFKVEDIILPIILIIATILGKIAIFDGIFEKSSILLSDKYKSFVNFSLLLSFFGDLIVVLVLVFLFMKAFGSEASIIEFLRFGCYGLFIFILFDIYVLFFATDIIPSIEELQTYKTGVRYLQIQLFINYGFYLWIFLTTIIIGKLKIIKSVASVSLPFAIFQIINYLFS